MSLNPKIMALPGDALLKLREEVNAAFEARSGEFLQPGKFARLYSEKKNRQIRVRITGFGIKYLQAEEVNEFGGANGARWRLTVSSVYPERTVVKPKVEKGTGADAPQHEAAGSF